MRTDGTWVGEEVSPYGPALGITYPHLDVDAALAAAARRPCPPGATPGPASGPRSAWRSSTQINARSFEMAHAVMHTSGQPFVMAFQAAGPHAQDRALEAVVAGLVEQERVPASVVWEKPGRDKEGNPAPIRMQKDYRLVPRGVALVIGCNTFPTWNSYPGLFASLVTGNPVIVKPHPRAVLPLAISVAVCREVLAGGGLQRRPGPARAGGRGRGAGQGPRRARRGADHRLHRRAGLRRLARGGGRRRAASSSTPRRPASTPSSSTRPTTCAGCWATSPSRSPSTRARCAPRPQNVYVPREGIETDEGHLSFEDFGARLAAAVGKLTGDDARAVELLGATVNDGVRANAAGLAALARGGRRARSCWTPAR